MTQGMVFTEEQVAFAESIRHFCERECGTREQRKALTDGGRESHSQELYLRMAELGWPAVAVPEEYGGGGQTLVEQVIFFEEAWTGQAPVMAAGPASTVAGCLLRGGSEAQKSEHLGAISEGAVMSISISEPEAGSDVGNISCSAKPGDGGFVINGQKTWCSSAHQATHILVVARTSREESRHDGLTLLLVPADAPGLQINGIETMGGREVNDVYFSDVFVPESAVVGDIGKGWALIMSGLDGERLICAGQGVGMARRALDDTLAYVKQRKQFGRPIGGFQALRHRIADLAIEVECAKLLTYEVAARLSAKRGSREELTRLTSMAKVKVTETAKRMALEGMQMMGGYGYATEYGMEHQVRMTLSPTIYAGTNEIQRDIISSTLGLR